MCAYVECIFGQKEEVDGRERGTSFRWGLRYGGSWGIQAIEVFRYLVGKNDENKVDKVCSGRYIIID